MVAHTTTVKGMDGTVMFEMVNEKIEVNVELKDELFTRPKPAPAAPAPEEKKDGN